MDGKQRQKDFSNIDVAWDELDCVAYTNTVEAVRDVSQPAVLPQQTAAAEISQTTSPDLYEPQYPYVIQDHVTWDWINDMPTSSPFEMTLDEVTGMADSLTENDWSE